MVQVASQHGTLFSALGPGMMRPIDIARCVALAGIALSAHVPKAAAQQLVGNNGFEDHTQLPDWVAQWNYCVGWLNPGSAPATPDYFHTQGSGMPQLPDCVFGHVQPYSGEAIMGLSAYHSFALDNREYLATELLAPLVPGQSYAVSFQVTNGEADHYCGFGTDGLGIRFSVGPLVQTIALPLGGVPHWELSSPLWATDWQTMSFTLSADQPYTHITIGNFRDDASTILVLETTGGQNCAYFFLDQLSVIPLINAPYLTGDSSICLGEQTVLTAESDTVHAWAAANDPAVIFSTDTSITVAPTVTTTYLFYGSDTLSITVHVLTPPSVDLGPDTTVCAGTSLILDPMGGEGSYLWTDGSTGPILSIDLPGVYGVTLTNACGSDASSIQVTQIPPPSVDLGPDTTVCSGAAITLSATGSGDTFLWNNGATTQDLEVVAPGTYWVAVANACGTAMDTVVVGSEGCELLVVALADAVCPGQLATISVEVSGGLPPYVIQLPEHGLVGPGPHTFVPDSAGPCAVLVIDAAGDTAMTVVWIEVLEAPFANFTWTITDNGWYTIQFEELSTGAAVWSWSFGDGATSGQPQPLHDYGQHGDHLVTLMVSSVDGCVDHMSTMITIPYRDPVLFIPNAVTPNDDGINDLLLVVHDGFQEISLMIFDRWGELLADMQGPDLSWDCSHRGRPVPDGVYVWRIQGRTAGKPFVERTGHVVVLR